MARAESNSDPLACHGWIVAQELTRDITGRLFRVSIAPVRNVHPMSNEIEPF
jgi:hypothetical protein